MIDLNRNVVINKYNNKTLGTYKKLLNVSSAEFDSEWLVIRTS